MHLPTFRDADGTWRTAIVLPDEIREGLCDAVLDFMAEEGVAKKEAPMAKDVEVMAPRCGSQLSKTALRWR